MKIFLTSLIIFLLSSFIVTNENLEYFIIYPNSQTVSFYQYGDESFLEYYLNKKVSINDIEYSVKIRKYSWGTIDTSYCRMDSKDFIHYKRQISAESKIIPRKPFVGEQWFESDSSWVYTILKTEQIFKSPTKNYNNCILVECKQLKLRDKGKSSVYHLFYSKGQGFVGNVDSKGNVLSYLKETVSDSKDGSILGQE